MLIELIYCVILVLIIFIYQCFQCHYKLWARLNVPYLRPKFPMGNVVDSAISNKHFSFIIQDLYERTKHMNDYVGIYFFNSPCLLVTCPEFAKTIMVRDFNYFLDRGVYSNEKTDPLSANLFFLEGLKWRNLRSKISPTFTSGKMKMMFHTVLGVTEELVHFLDTKSNGNDEIDVTDILTRFTTDVIGTTAFGIECNSLKNPKSDFWEMGKRISRISKSKLFILFLCMVNRNLARMLGLRFTDKNDSKVFMNLIHNTIEYREKNNIKKRDFIELMMQLKKQGKLEVTDLDEDDDDELNDGKTNFFGSLTFEEIAAQCWIFFFAGMESTATTLTVALHHLAINQEFQDIAREEVNRVIKKFNGKITYEAIKEMNYIENVVFETLRIFPPVGTIHRIVTKNYPLPNGSILPKGTFVVIPNMAFQHDADIFPDPLKFDPNRFTNENKNQRHNFSFIPFGEGPRNCIGMRFALMVAKIGLVKLLKNFYFSIGDNRDVNIEIHSTAFLHTPKNKILLKIKRTKNENEL